MPSVIDTSGQIGQAFGFVATPYNILIDRAGSVAFLGRAPEERLDALLAGLSEAGAGGAGHAGSIAVQAPTEPGFPAEGDPAPPFEIETLSGETFTLASAAAEGPVYLLFFAAWCESYMAGEGEDPEEAASCAATRKTVDAAFAGPGGPPRLIGIATRMWTGTQDLEQYRDEFKPSYPLALDVTNEVFRLYGVREFPTLIAIGDGRILRRLAGTVEAFPRP
jgi:peroxiredoxin